jgi:DNA adenine methylase
VHDNCGGLLMMPYEAGAPVPAGVEGVAFCSSCSPRRGLVAPGEQAFARAREASKAAGAVEHVGELRASYVGAAPRVALERALSGDAKGAKRKRNGFALCRSFRLVNDDGTATEAGRAFACRVGLVVPAVSPCAPADPEPAPATVAEPAPAAPAVEARSPWRWVGGKGALLPEITAAMPEKFGRLFVPFVGGGALVFAMAGRVAYISDANTHLINAYVAIRDRVEDLILALQDHKNDRDYYDAVVESFNDGYGDDIWRAAAFMYMNKVGFNGLCRYNRKGGYNVPFGDNPKAKICDADNLRACAAALRGIDIVAEDFRAVEDRAQPGDLVYLDCPYIPESKTAAFTGYWGKWGDEEHEAVPALFRRLAARGVHVLASNSDTPKARELYSGFEIRTLTRANSVNSKASARGGKAEILVLGGTWAPKETA